MRAALLALAMIASVALAGCSSGSKSEQSGGESASPSAAAAATEQPQADNKPVTFTYFNAGAQNKDVNSNETEIGKILEKQTGVNWKMEYLVGDINTKIGTMIASGDYPDVLVPDTAIDKVLDAGGFIPLNKLIDQYAPNIKKIYGPYYNQMKQKDGNIYFLPFSPLVGKYIPSPTIDQGAFWVQRRVLKDANYPKIKTLDEYFNLIKQYADKHKSDNLIGFTSLTFDWRIFALTNAPNHLDGYPNDGGVIVDMKTHQANDYGNDEITKRWLQKLNEMNAEGLYDKSSFVNNYDQYLARLTSGKVLGYFDYGWQVNQAMQTLNKAGNDDLEYFPLPIVFDNNIKDQYLDPPSFVNNRGVGITTSAKDPVRIIKFFDNMLKEENQVLTQWGIKGETYEVNDKGRFYRTQQEIDKLKDNAYRNQVGLSYFGYYWPMYGGGSTLSDGNSFNAGRQPEVAQASFTDGDKLILGKYGVQTYSQMFAAPDDRPWYPAWSISLEQGSPAQIFSQKKQDLERKYFPKMVLAKPAEFDSVWNEYLTAFNKLDVKAYEDTMTKLIKEKIAKVIGSN